MNSNNNNYTKTITSNELYENTYKPIIQEARKNETLQSNFEPLGPTFDFLKDTTPFTPDTNKNIHTETKEYETNEKLWDIGPLFNNRHTNDLETKSQTFKDVWQYKEKMFAETTLTCMKVTNLVENILKTEFEEINMIKETLFNFLLPQNMYKGGHENEKRNEELTLELKYGPGDSQHDFKPSKTRNFIFPNEIKTSKQPTNIVNGTKVLDAISRITLNSQGTKTRILNSYFEKSPNAFEEDVKVDYLLGDLAGKLDDISYYFTCGPKSHIWDDVTKNWQDKRRDFFKTNEPLDSIDLLFEAVQEHGIEYWLYDACMDSNIRKGLTPPEFFSLAKIWDPSTSSKHPLSQLSEYKLSNEDNNGNSKFTKIVIQPNNKYSTKENQTIIPEDYELYDWTNENNESYYDKIYDDLLNQDLLTRNLGIKIKLRIAAHKDNKSKSKSNNSTEKICAVAICVYVQDSFHSVIFVDSGFSVKELSIGMHYIETGESIFDLGTKHIEINENLYKLINILDNIWTNLSSNNSTIRSMFNKTEYYKLLLRFKSSGDHGQGEMVKLLNLLLNKPTVFLSGDNLAYVYSIADETPTIARYYSPRTPTSDEQEEDDEDDDAVHSGPQFVVAYFPMKDTVEKYKKLFNKKISIIGSLIDPNYSNPNYNEKDKIVKNEFVIDEDLFNNLQENIYNIVQQGNSFISELSTNLQNITINDYKNQDFIIQEKKNKKKGILPVKNENEEILQSNIDTKINEIFSTKINNIDLLSIIEEIPNSMDILFQEGEDYNYDYMKNYNMLVNEFITNWYFIKNYIKIVKLTKTNIYDMIYNMNEIISVASIINITTIILPNDSIKIRQGNENNIVFNTMINKVLHDKYVNWSKENISKDLNKQIFLDIAEDITSTSTSKSKTNSKTLRDDLLNVRSNMIATKIRLSSKLITDLEMPSELYNELVNNIEKIKKDYLDKVKQKINMIPDYGEVLNEFFSKSFETNINDEKNIELYNKQDKNNTKLDVIKSVLKESNLEESSPLPEINVLIKSVGKKKTAKGKKVNEIVIDSVIETLNAVTEEISDTKETQTVFKDPTFDDNELKVTKREKAKKAALKRIEAAEAALKRIEVPPEESTLVDRIKARTAQRIADKEKLKNTKKNNPKGKFGGTMNKKHKNKNKTKRNKYRNKTKKFRR